MQTDNFDKIPYEKRIKIINAGFSQFCKNGYDKTAMSEIARAAGVSKALLFHYFGTKKDLYYYLYCFACDEITKNFRIGTEDFFESIAIGLEIKTAILKGFPGMSEFLTSVALEGKGALIDGLRATNKTVADKAAALLFERVDCRRFKPEFGLEKAMNLVSWISDGYIKAYGDKKSVDEIVAEIREYLNLIKKIVYKEEYL
jgi:AcrR family transcriptional regulator